MILCASAKNYQNRQIFHGVIQKVAHFFETRCISVL